MNPSPESLSEAIKALAKRKYIEQLLIVDPENLVVVVDSHTDHFGEPLQRSLATLTWKFLRGYLVDRDLGMMTMDVNNLRYQITPFNMVAPDSSRVASNLLLVVFDQTELIQREWRRLLGFCGIFGAALLFMAIINHFLLRRTLIKPMQQITNIIEEQQNSDETLFLPDLGIDELGVLTRSYNELARDRASQQRKLKEARRYVEGITHQAPVLILYHFGGHISCT